MHFEKIKDSAQLGAYYHQFGLAGATQMQWLIVTPDEMVELQEEGSGLLARMLVDEPKNFSELGVLHRQVIEQDEPRSSFVILLNLDVPIPGRHTVDYCKAQARTDLEQEFAQALEAVRAQAIAHAHARR